jgi:hypothetical protein
MPAGALKCAGGVHAAGWLQPRPCTPNGGMCRCFKLRIRPVAASWPLKASCTLAAGWTCAMLAVCTGACCNAAGVQQHTWDNAVFGSVQSGFRSARGQVQPLDVAQVAVLRRCYVQPVPTAEWLNTLRSPWPVSHDSWLLHADIPASPPWWNPSSCTSAAVAQHPCRLPNMTPPPTPPKGW